MNKAKFKYKDPVNIRLDRIERMLKWLVIKKKCDYLSYDLKHNDYRHEFRGQILDEMFKLGGQLPNISDILEEGDER